MPTQEIIQQRLEAGDLLKEQISHSVSAEKWGREGFGTSSSLDTHILEMQGLLSPDRNVRVEVTPIAVQNDAGETFTTNETVIRLSSDPSLLTLYLKGGVHEDEPLFLALYKFIAEAAAIQPELLRQAGFGKIVILNANPEGVDSNKIWHSDTELTLENAILYDLRNLGNQVDYDYPVEYNGQVRTTRLLGCLASQEVIRRILEEGSIDLFISGHNAVFGTDITYLMHSPSPQAAEALSEQQREASQAPAMPSEVTLASEEIAPGVHDEKSWLEGNKSELTDTANLHTFLGMSSAEYVAQKNKASGYAPTFSLAIETALFLTRALGDDRLLVNMRKNQAQAKIIQNISNNHESILAFLDLLPSHNDPEVTSLVEQSRIIIKTYSQRVLPSLQTKLSTSLDTEVTAGEYAGMALRELYALRPHGQVIRAARLLERQGIIDATRVKEIEKPFFEIMEQLKNTLNLRTRTITEAVQSAFGSLIVAAAYADSTARKEK